MARQRRLQIMISLYIIIFAVVLAIVCVIMAKRLHAEEQHPMTAGAAVAYERLQGEINSDHVSMDVLQRQIDSLKEQQTRDMNILAQQGSELYMIRGGVSTLTYLGGGISILVTMLSGISIAINLTAHRRMQMATFGTEELEVPVVKRPSGSHKVARREE